ncbi:unnamed protein product, partial [Eretmochelys imbricata]
NDGGSILIDLAKNDLERITADYVALERRIKEFEVQVVFSSILLVEGKGLGRDRRIEPVAFEEVAVYFTREEWALLDGMQENYENVTSLVRRWDGE